MSTPSPQEPATAGPEPQAATALGREGTAGLGRDDVAHLARLARLALADEELDHFAGQLSAVLDAVAEVGKADVADVPPMTHAVPLTNVTRDDVVSPSLPRDVVLAQAPAAEDNRFRVPQILGEE
ncbi:Asp-tRNA(Asn)/Glu-tRNA(Gln) amidotransferase subunit GatC [Geodermatophilus sp. DF01-2]|nr:Asp-tRNA(Asn)/Glu-tRNA(Gln) amidotransferase subunit GatC [Geodermatophilus sp. DF01_2]TFV55470.1 Asp-tRNA(Asn)/Glu-tRNA(Gln) amidotransferase subunit GatC [Geodermatophilus sp. DF01_2]